MPERRKKAVYAAYLEYKQGVYDRLTYELTEGATPYSKLSKEYQVYQSNIVSLLLGGRRDHEGTGG